MEKRIVIACGGTGGHLYPAIALAEQIEERVAGVQCVFAGHGLSHNPYFRKELLQEDVAAAPLSLSLSSSLPRKVFYFCKETVRGVREGHTLLHQMNPKLVIGFGSYHTFPLLLSTVYSRVPLYLFAGDIIPGKVVRLFSRFATATGCFFPDAKRVLKGQVLQQYLPLRRSMGNTVGVYDSKLHYGFDPKKPVLLIMGGSHGAKFLNELILKECNTLDPDVQLLHIVGFKADIEAITSRYASKGRVAKVLAFEKNMALAFQAADLLLARAGASTLAELLTFQVPSILVPYPHAAEDHQKANAHYFMRQNACFVHEEKDPPIRLLESIKRLLCKVEREKMKRAQLALWHELHQNELLNKIIEQVNV